MTQDYYSYSPPIKPAQISSKPRHHRPIKLINPDTQQPVLLQNTDLKTPSSPTKSDASPIIKEQRPFSPVKSAASIDAEQKTKRSFMEQVKALALAAQEEAEIDTKRKEEEEYRNVEEEDKVKETRFAEEARLTEEARVAEEARLVEDVRLVEETRMTDEARLAEKTCLTEEALLAEKTRVTEEAGMADETCLAEKASKAEESLLTQGFHNRPIEKERETEQEIIVEEHIEKILEEKENKEQHKPEPEMKLNNDIEAKELKRDHYRLEKIAAIEETIKSKVESLNHTIQSSISSQHRIYRAKRLTISELQALKYPKGVKTNTIIKYNNVFVYTVDFLKQFASIVTFPPKENWADVRALIVTESFEPQRSHFSRLSTRGNISQNMGFFSPSFGGNNRINNAGNFQNATSNMNRMPSRPILNMNAFSSQRSGRQSSQRRSGSSYFDGPHATKVTLPPTTSLPKPALAVEQKSTPAPLKRAANAWTPKIRSKTNDAVDGLLTEEAIIRKSKSLLNKMTAENFDSISDQLVEITKQSEKETTGLALRTVVNQTFDKAVDEAHWSAIYAKFCAKLVQTINPEVQQEGLLNKAGEPIKGYSLVRRYLITKCQVEFEKGWTDKIPTNEDGTVVEAEMMSDEYYKAVAAKRRGLGLVRFIGEMYILKLLTANTIQTCFSRLLIDPKDMDSTPSEEAIESACKLMITVGPSFEEEIKNRPGGAFKTIMERFAFISKDKSLSSRFRFMILDMIDLYKGGWAKVKKNNQPKSIAEIHAEDRRAKAAAAAALSHGQRDYHGSNRHCGSGFGGRSSSSRSTNMATISPNDINKLRKFRASSSSNSSAGVRGHSSSPASSSTGEHSTGWNSSGFGRGSSRHTSISSSPRLGGGSSASINSSASNGSSNSSNLNPSNAHAVVSKSPSSRNTGNLFAPLANHDE
jgi:translation initiation factor 4G